jgi:hypothetical protein
MFLILVNKIYFYYLKIEKKNVIIIKVISTRPKFKERNLYTIFIYYICIIIV